jgi:hypothetical protein
MHSSSTIFTILLYSPSPTPHFSQQTVILKQML